MKVKTRVIKMLKENTGKAMMDSGDAYGRHWEKNQEIDFNKEPQISIDIDNRNNELSISLTRSLYHYLVENLNITEESEKLDAMFKGLMKKSDNGYLADMEEFGKMFDFIGVCNSYNGESFLSQVIQYVIFRQGETSFIILQIHNGCDVRGGYTEPRIFEIDDKYLPSDSDFYTNDGHYTDDGYHWYSDDTSNEVKPVDIWYEKEDKLYDKKTNKEVVFL